jgi:hypothetical protein
MGLSGHFPMAQSPSHGWAQVAAGRAADHGRRLGLRTAHALDEGGEIRATPEAVACGDEGMLRDADAKGWW